MTAAYPELAGRVLDARGVVSVVRVEIETLDGTLRFPVLKGLRTDLAPVEVGPGEGLGD